MICHCVLPYMNHNACLDCEKRQRNNFYPNQPIPGPKKFELPPVNKEYLEKFREQLSHSKKETELSKALDKIRELKEKLYMITGIREPEWPIN